VSYNKIGDVLVAQGNLPEALKSFRDGHDIFDRLAKADAGNAGWQRDLSVSDTKIGDVLAAQGNLPEALKSFRDGLAIADRLAKADPGNAGWQRDLSVSDNKIGDMLVDQGNLPEALKSFRDALAIRDRLAKADPGNAGWQRDLSASYVKIGDVLKAQGNLPEALESYRNSVAIDMRRLQSDPYDLLAPHDLLVDYRKVGSVQEAQGELAEALTSYRASLAHCEALIAKDKSNAQWQNDRGSIVSDIGSLAFGFVLARDFNDALESADQSISLLPDQIWLYTNRAHALMFLDRTVEARTLYLQYQGRTDVQNDKPWDTVIIEDFAAFRKAGLSNPLMDEIEKQFAPGK
jgi:tetratricopeptide (TPR) repeat protein